jgi:hypothetical protein
MISNLMEGLKMTPKKACPKCGKEKKLSPKFWQRDARKADGYTTQCKACRHAYDRQRDAIRNKLPSRRLLLHVMNVNARARANGDTVNVITVSDVLDKLKQADYLCYWCGGELGERFDIEHIQPFALGGNNTSGNITVSCRSCNASKGARSVEQWLLVLASRGIAHKMAIDVPLQLALWNRKN